MKGVLVVNAGSSSIKFAAFDGSSPDATIALLFRGAIAMAGARVALHVEDAQGRPLESSSFDSASNELDHDIALDHLFAWLDGRQATPPFVAVGHRVVHGGDRHVAPVVVTDDVRRELEALVPLAPLHQPHNLKPIDAVRRRWPDVVQVACFDTAFHAGQSRVARAFALPRAITDRGVRRYGFHGLSYEYVATQLPRVIGDAARDNVIVAHLGNGASLCAMADGRSVATTMGFSVLDGLMMGTRCGTLDPGVLLHLLQHAAFDVDSLTELLYHRSGLLGVSGVSADMAVLLDSRDAHAAEAIDLFVHRIVVEIGGLAAALGGLDALVFTGGIGEHAAVIRDRICAGCAWLGAEVDPAAAGARMDTPASRVRLAVVPTDEERMIALHTRDLIDA